MNTHVTTYTPKTKRTLSSTTLAVPTNVGRERMACSDLQFGRRVSVGYDSLTVECQLNTIP
jgi:hypothetical protein